MRSLIILEVEHGETTDAFQALAERLGNSHPAILNYTVRVDVPECFSLDTADVAPVWCEDCDLDHDPNFCPSHMEP